MNKTWLCGELIDVEIIADVMDKRNDGASSVEVGNQPEHLKGTDSNIFTQIKLHSRLKSKDSRM